MPGENIQDWSTTAATNATADTLINWAEGQPRASVNNSARSMMAAHAKNRNLLNGSITTGGTANAQTFTSGVTYTTVPTGLTVRLKVGVTNTGATTLNMDSIGAVAIKDQSGNDIGANALLLNRYVDLLYDGTNWILLSASGAATAPFDALAFSGMQINGAMEISQEKGTTATAFTSNHIVDGWIAVKSGTMVTSGQQVADAPVGYTNSLKVTVSTAQAVLGIGDYTIIAQKIEGFRSSRLQFGTANAQSVSIGFWTKIHRVGSYSGSLRNAADNRSYGFTFTQNVADTWEYKTVTIPGDTSGTWIGNTNGVGLLLSFCMAAGTAFTNTANVWTAASLIGVTSTTNGVAATTDTFQITGVIVLPGADLPAATRAPFIMRSYDQELLICKRYFQQSFVINSNDGVGGGMAVVLYSTRAASSGVWPVEMRAAPSLTTYSPSTGATGNLWFPGIADVAMSSVPSVTAKGWGAFFDAPTSMLPIGQTGVFNWRVDARL